MMKILSKKRVFMGFVLLCTLVLLTACGQTAGEKGSTDQSADQTEKTISTTDKVSDFFNKFTGGSVSWSTPVRCPPGLSHGAGLFYQEVRFCELKSAAALKNLTFVK